MLGALAPGPPTRTKVRSTSEVLSKHRHTFHRSVVRGGTRPRAWNRLRSSVPSIRAESTFASFERHSAFAMMDGADSLGGPIERRVCAQTWDLGNSIDVFGSRVAELCCNIQELSRADYEAKSDDCLFRIGRIDLSRKAALGALQATVSDVHGIQMMTEKYKSQATDVAKEVAELRRQLAREQRAKARREQYRALLKIVKSQQPRSVSKRLAAKRNADFAKLQEQSKQLTTRKKRLFSEFAMFRQVMAGLRVFVTTGEIQYIANGTTPAKGDRTVKGTAPSAGTASTSSAARADAEGGAARSAGLPMDTDMNKD